VNRRLWIDVAERQPVFGLGHPIRRYLPVGDPAEQAIGAFGSLAHRLSPPSRIWSIMAQFVQY
jgi:hypothetical protein